MIETLREVFVVSVGEAHWSAWLALLMLIVFGSHMVEAITGFGCTIIAVTLGALFLPIEFLVPVLIPINLILSSYIVIRYRREIDVRRYFTRILPLVCLGVPAGFAMFQLAQNDGLKLGYGIFVVLISFWELVRELRPGGIAKKPLGEAQGAAWLIAGGVIHGLYASGGPLIVYYSSRALAGKAAFRATLSSLWLAMGIVLSAGHLWQGTIDARTATMSAVLIPPLLLGIVVGDVLHARIDERRFRLFVLGLLIFAGTALMIETMRG